ncbi:PREDICTED: uncharacterized protein LOC105119798 [Populus euphratica]|uniref:Uncharacterized protein LOC105119798 n=1 Tax=Populus euphratica TaxID=75702 RepID=A0AAJ6XF42_POPEU|nr:PREDICTED: uncharacterized protein LOC105119798 [Populus euphratica]
MTSQGHLTSSLEEVGSVFVNYFQQQLGIPTPVLPLDSVVIQSGLCLSSDSQALLLASVSPEEIQKAVFSIGDDKAPGPDGYSSLFFKQAWHIISEDFCSTVQDFFHSGKLLKQINHSIIALVPKSSNVTSPSDFRPISCCNVIYKVIAKILAARLAHALMDIISPYQNAFLGGRFMSDNINLVQELLRVKVASDKANLSLPIFFYATWNDILLLSRGDLPSIRCLLHQLTLFGQISGLVINPQKSSIYFGGVSNAQRIILLSETGFRERFFPFTYLGVPLSPHRLLASQFSPLLQDLELVIQGWIGKNLTYAGRLELLRSVLYGKVHFWLNIFPMPEIVIHSIISTCRNFLWTGDARRHHSALVSWKTLCLRKTEGGLGLFDLKACNRSFLTKQLWNIHLKIDSTWIRWVHHFYLNRDTIWHAQAHQHSSPLWKAIISIRDNLVQHCEYPGESIQLLRSWSSSKGTFVAHAYQFFRPSGPTIPWHRVVWEHWSLAKYSFILWLAVLGKLRTCDRLQFLHVDPTCAFCS